MATQEFIIGVLIGINIGITFALLLKKVIT